MSHRAAFALLLASMPLVVGCGPKPLEFGQAEGTVLVGGKPQRGIAVRFLPDPEKGNNLPVNASGTSDAQGHYTLRHTYQGKEGEGTVVGWQRVVLEDTALNGIPQGQPLPPQIIPPAYNSPATTPLRFEIKPGPQTIDLEVKR